MLRFHISLIALLLSVIGVFALPVEMRYWINRNIQEATTVGCTAGDVAIEIPLESLGAGRVNTLNVQIKGEDGLWSPTYQYNLPLLHTESPALMYSIDRSEWRSLEDSHIDISRVSKGLHQLYIIDSNNLMPPASTFFFRNNTSPGTLKLAFTSSKNRINKTISIESTDSECSIDVKDMPPGVYPVNIAITDTVTGSLVALHTTNVEVKAYSGNRLTDIYYWLNDSIGQIKRYELKDAQLPVKASVELPITGFNVPSLDYRLSLDDGHPYIAPTYGFSLSFRNSYSFAADSSAMITDASRLAPLAATSLLPSTQHDTALWRTDSCYWYQFEAIAGDNISLSARLKCKVKMYSPEAALVDTVTFTLEKLELRKALAETGTYYVQMSEIEESRREFSVLLTYLSGPTAGKNNPSTEVVYEGVPVEWKKSTDWEQEDGGMSYSTKGIKMAVYAGEAMQAPYVTVTSNICRTYGNNRIEFSADKYIEQVTMCLPSVPDYDFPRLLTSHGEVEVDTTAAIIVWKGFSKKVEMTISPTTDTTQLPVTKAYVKLSELTEADVYYPAGDETSGDIDYKAFNRVRLWRSGVEEASYSLLDDTKITFDSDAIIISACGATYRHTTTTKLILTFDYDGSGVDDMTVPDSSAEVAICGENIKISGLPAHVGIYSVSGLTYYQDYIDDRTELYYPINNLPAGIYIVRVGAKSVKVLIP